MSDIIRDIRTRLRLSMNGVVSTSMREKGVDYKLNFGVSLPKIKEIASNYQKDANLANVLWQEDVRELKILATLLQPIESFTPEQAELWAGEVTRQEIAEQYSMNLLQYLPFAEELAHRWIYKMEGYTPVLGYILYARLFTKGVEITSDHAEELLKQAKDTMDAGESRLQRAAILAIKRYGRQNPKQAAKVLKSIEEYATVDSPEKQEFFNDIKFEFDYYL